MNHNFGPKQSGFTLIEIIIVVVMLGVLAGIAIPKLLGPNELILSSEGRQTLMNLLSAQKRYQLENAVYTTSMANLDISIPVSVYFEAPAALDGSSLNNVASVQRKTNSYTLLINTSGIITCSNGTSSPTCANIRCTKGGGSNQCNQ